MEARDTRAPTEMNDTQLAFEAYAITQYKNISLEKDDGVYCYSLASVGWQWWQASRKSLADEQTQQVIAPYKAWAEWQTKGEALIEGTNNGIAFALGEWWADRPWRAKK